MPWKWRLAGKFMLLLKSSFVSSFIVSVVIVGSLTLLNILARENLVSSRLYTTSSFLYLLLRSLTILFEPIIASIITSSSFFVYVLWCDIHVLHSLHRHVHLSPISPLNKKVVAYKFHPLTVKSHSFMLL